MSKDKWGDYWENESETGECFVSKSGEKNTELANFWLNEIQSENKNETVLDIASGAGSIFASLKDCPEVDLYASDLSFNALRKQSQRNCDTKLIVAEADKRVFATESFDLIVSQFGIEYAPKEAFFVANELVKPGGKLVFLCHIKDGYIDSKNQIENTGIELTVMTRFIEIAISVTEAMFQSNEQTIAQELAVFRDVEPRMAQYAQLNGAGLQYHLYYGFRKMMESIKNYNCSDIVNWLKQMNDEINKIKPRLDEMMKAAQSRQDVADISRILIASGSENIEITPFYLSLYEKPIAWKIVAIKQK